MFVSEILASFRVFRGQIALFRVFSGLTTAEILTHETRQMTRKDEKAELIYKEESSPLNVSRLLVCFVGK
jgi:hypothetical protein